MQVLQGGGIDKEAAKEALKEVFTFDPFTVSFLLFALTSINVLVETHGRLMQVGAASTEMTKKRYFWYYFSLPWTYLVKTMFGIFVIFLMIIVVVALMTGIINLIKGGPAKNLSPDDLKDAFHLQFSKSIQGVIKSTLSYLMYVVIGVKGKDLKFFKEFKVYKLPLLLRLFGIALPLFVFFFMLAQVFTRHTSSHPEEEAKRPAINTTQHHILYFMLVCFIVFMLLDFATRSQGDS